MASPPTVSFCIETWSIGHHTYIPVIRGEENEEPGTLDKSFLVALSLSLSLMCVFVCFGRRLHVIQANVDFFMWLKTTLNS